MSNAELYDTHCHLDFSEFDGVREDLLVLCCQKNISRLIVPAVGRNTWQNVQALANRSQQVYYALGIHPMFVQGHSIDDLKHLEDLVDGGSKKLVAIGEIGLDAQAGNLELQRMLFSGQLALASECNLPVIMHARRTHSQILSELKKFRLSGVIHAFSGSEELLGQYINKGVSIGVGCVITWPSAHRTRDAVSKAPLSSLVLETDSPDMRVSHKPSLQPGSPLDVRDVFQALCNIRSESPECLASALRQNADRIFFNRC
jgi:TatD DNase family protein